MNAFDVIVVGGGLVGSAVGYGLARQGASVAVLDEGDIAYRASRGNFGLVWVQGKGDGLPAYADWSRGSAELWPELAETLSGVIGRDIGYRKPGGVHICLTDEEVEDRRQMLARMHNAAGPGGYDCRFVDRRELAEMLPGLGPNVAGGTYSPHDGHVSPLYLLRSLHAGLGVGSEYRAGARVSAIEKDGAGFSVRAGDDTITGEKVVIAAGLAGRELGRQVGLDIPVDPLKGQILITEKAKPLLTMPTTFVRQTEEGGFMLGDSHEDAGFDIGSRVDVMADIAARAVRSFPILSQLRIVRAWAALRIMTPDGFPVYDESESHPGAFAVTCHSGVTLAAAHALKVAPAILDGSFREAFSQFSAKRFDVQTH